MVSESGESGLLGNVGVRGSDLWLGPPLRTPGVFVACFSWVRALLNFKPELGSLKVSTSVH